MKTLTARKTPLMFVSTALLAGMMIYATPSRSETVTHETVTTTKDGRTVSQSVTMEKPSTDALEMPAAVHTETRWTTEQPIVTGPKVVHFMDFDMNRDGMLSIGEVGEMLFKLFDSDGNRIIDNIEYEQNAVLTIMPMEKNTITAYDLDGDGVPDKTEYTYEAVMQETELTRFDMNKNGLSPHEFTAMHFNGADVNNDRVIDLAEWQGTYIPAIDKMNRAKARFNN